MANRWAAQDRETGKIITENGGKYPLGSKALIYLLRKVEEEGGWNRLRKNTFTKIKATVILCQNSGLTMKLVRKFEEQSAEAGHHSVIKKCDQARKGVRSRLEGDGVWAGVPHSGWQGS